jgi:ATP-dependent helicase HrpA
LPEVAQVEAAQQSVTVYPALLDAGESVTLQPLDTAQAAQAATAQGLTRLFVLAAHAEVKALKREVAQDKALCLLYAALPALKGVEKPCADMQDEVVWRVARAVFLQDMPPAAWPREREAFAARVTLCRPQLYAEGLKLLQGLRALLTAAQAIRGGLQAVSVANALAAQDVTMQFDGLFSRHFVRELPDTLWRRLPVYVQAMVRRLERLKQNPERDRLARASLESVQLRVAKLKVMTASVPEDVRYMLEELRVQVFAQELKTAMPVSVTRMNALLDGYGA